MRSHRPQIRLFAAVTMLLMCVASAAAFWAPVKHKRDLRAEVTAADQLWCDAQLANDVAAMDKMLSDDYLGIMGNGQVVTKEQQLERMRSRQMVFEKLQLSDVKVKIVGSSAAIVTSSAELDGSADGHKIHGVFRSTRVYQRAAGGTWKITNFEATPARGQGLTPPQT